MIDLNIPIEKIGRVGPKFLARLKKLGIKSIRDLLWHIPTRYEDYSNLVEICDISEKGQSVSIAGQVSTIDLARSWRRRMTIVNAVIRDESGSIRAVWFNQPYILDTLRPGTLVSISGKISADKKGLYFSSPSYEKISAEEVGNQDKKINLTHTARLVPIYPETEGLTSKYLRFLIKPLVERAAGTPDPLPQYLLKKHNLPTLPQAIKMIHFPNELIEAEQARQRFAFEEILLFQIKMLRDHQQLRSLIAPQIFFDKESISNFVKNLPFDLTNDQRIATYEILQDLDKTFPMNRLLNGDVGSGKTVVALIAAFQSSLNDLQTVFMAPTEILANQHYETIKKMIFRNKKNNGRRIRIGLLTSSSAKQWPIDEVTEENITKKIMAQKIAHGEIDILIGTHAVISTKGAAPASGRGSASSGQNSISFAKLGLVVIDEQHRFGVAQRMALQKNSGSSSIPHLLSMTATPIPRTLALTIYGDLDVSLLKEKPKNRLPIQTRVVSQDKRKDAHKFIGEQVSQGRQVFVICPRIDVATVTENKTQKTSQAQIAWAEVKAVTEEYDKLSKLIFPDKRVAMLHGKLKPKEKDKIMRDFKNGHHDILVSTSVVEVGVDVPNATVMMIESAERFGLAQLHQFRGRVGRGTEQSYCFLFTSSESTPAGRRLKAMEKTNDGFKLAEEDLKIRGPGEFTGTKQSGLPDIAMSSISDIELIKKARLEAKLIIKEDPSLKKYPALSNRLDEIQKFVHFE
ncbi:MAG TPA: ATP-dependent DNA helicase RecG [Candidatus Paceibacterota bacterium]